MMFKLDDRIDFQNKSNDLLTVGEVLIDMISADYDESFESKTYNKFFGGSPANIAMNVRKLGTRSLLASAVGKDGLGMFLNNHLLNAGIDITCIQQVDYST